MPSLESRISNGQNKILQIIYKANWYVHQIKFATAPAPNGRESFSLILNILRKIQC